MILHSKYCSLSIAGFLKRILLKIYFISPFYLYKLESPLPKDHRQRTTEGCQVMAKAHVAHDQVS